MAPLTAERTRQTVYFRSSFERKNKQWPHPHNPVFEEQIDKEMHRYTVFLARRNKLTKGTQNVLLALFCRILALEDRF